MFLIPLNISELTTSKFFLKLFSFQVALQSFFQKVTAIKNEKKISIKKLFIIPNFWCQIFFPTNHFWFLNYSCVHPKPLIRLFMLWNDLFSIAYGWFQGNAMQFLFANPNKYRLGLSNEISYEPLGQWTAQLTFLKVCPWRGIKKGF